MKNIKYYPVSIYEDYSPLYPNVPYYEALSYARGENDESDNVPIKLNGQPFTIAPNLHSALLVLRDNPNLPHCGLMPFASIRTIPLKKTNNYVSCVQST
ncbi:hypothetical protein EYC80_000771 [Monilinia laxa]|uniref:Uncharacterized protein n=1 Tax=Monilinia laxa TaxID=61186 RepID=A0A5N6K714_MONLA|nr:hypothetical protein EYC80_000771 [Monilinia laxa]